jgi:hypothetical protein
VVVWRCVRAYAVLFLLAALCRFRPHLRLPVIRAAFAELVRGAARIKPSCVRTRRMSFRSMPGCGPRAIRLAASAPQNFSTHGRTSISEVHALRSCCSRCR